jgi:hypothetical protein
MKIMVWTNSGDEVLNNYFKPAVGNIFHRDRSATDQIFYYSQILEKKWEYNGAV